MTSPDLRRYVDLTIHDRDARQLVDQAIADAAAKLAGWIPREGHSEVVLIEAMALQVAELIYAINRLPGAVTEALIGLYGITRGTGVAPTATATFHMVDAAGYAIPAATRLRLNIVDVGPLVFTTDVELVIAPGLDEGDVAITADTSTDEANGTPIGTALDLLDSISDINSAELAAVAGGGVPPEGTIEWLDRAIERLSRITSVLVLPAHFTSAALEDIRVLRATTLDNNNEGVEALGHVTVAVAAGGGVALSAPVRAEIEAVLEAAAQVNLDVHVVDATVTPVDVTSTVRRLPGYTDAQVIASVEAVLREYLDPDTWEWGATVRRNELIVVIDAAEGVDYVETVTVPADDVALAGVGPLADDGVLTITTNAA